METLFSSCFGVPCCCYWRIEPQLSGAQMPTRGPTCQALQLHCAAARNAQMVAIVLPRALPPERWAGSFVVYAKGTGSLADRRSTQGAAQKNTHTHTFVTQQRRQPLRFSVCSFEKETNVTLPSPVGGERLTMCPVCASVCVCNHEPLYMKRDRSQ